MSGHVGKQTIAGRSYLGISILVLALKAWAYYLTKSQAIFSDAVESIINVIAAVISMWAVYVSAKPADQDHPYGHGKVEYFSSAFEGGMIAVAAIVIAVEAVRTMIHGSQIHDLGQGVIYLIISTALNLLLGMFLLNVAKTSRSITLRASGLHVLSDVWTTMGVVVSMGLVVIFKATWIDPVAAIIVAFFLAKTGIGLVGQSVNGLLDAEDKQILVSLKEIISEDSHPGIIQVHHCRIMRSGNYHHIDAHAVVPEFWSVLEAHDKTSEFEHRMIKRYPYDGELHVHTDPCRRAYCAVCDVEACPIRRTPFVKKLPVTLEALVNPEEPEYFKQNGDHPA